jgi:Skp family chaperone for outer membrane proteins
MERAKQIAQGVQVNPSDTPTEFNKQPESQSVRRIKMRTNATVNRYGAPEAQPVQETTPATESAITDTSDVTPEVEATAPLSPQLAELAKQRRALQVKEREIADREKALESQPTPQSGVADLESRIKSQPLSVLQEYGVTYDQLTEAILSGQSGANPEIAQLKAEIKALKEGVDKTFSDKESQAEQQVLAEIQRDIDRRAESGDEFELIRVTGSQADVKDLIHRTFRETGEVLDTEEAMKLIEDELIEENFRIANANKIKSRLTPATPPQQQPSKPPIRTLTNRDTASPVLDRRARALAAALGTLRK